MENFGSTQTPIKSTDEFFNKSLNPSQLEAVYFTQGPLLVIAGAGSGKTRTLTYRVARLVSAGIPPARILLLTFTRRSSQEMIQRASTILDQRCGNVSGGTFHSIANNLLRRYGRSIHLESDFSIIDRTDSQDLIDMIKKEMKLSSKHHKFPKKSTLANIFGKSINKVESIESTIEKDFPHFTEFTADIQNIYYSYKRQKLKHNFLDYDDLLIFLRTMLTDQPDIRQKIASDFEYVMVDEYQDTNKIQSDIIYLICQSHQNIMVVGDDSQSIYSFRGANFKNIMDFPKTYPNAKIIKLEENYRSTQPILNLTNIIISRAKEKYTKTLFTQKEGGDLPVLIETNSENQQSQFIVEQIQSQIENGVSLNQIAVLFRAGFHSFDLEIELNRAKLPFIKVGGFKFAESAHIKDFLAHLKVIANPSDRLSWFRILLLLENIGPKKAQSLYDTIIEKELSHTNLSPLKACLKKSNRSILSLVDLFQQIDISRMTLCEIGQKIIGYYKPSLEKKYDDHPKRQKDLEHLLNILERYKNIDAFLTDMALEPPNSTIDNTLSTDYTQPDHLTLSTIHSAKGLEWKTVFILWALEGRFPSFTSMRYEDDMEEELRLMYVAATRARENLFFMCPQQIYDRNSGTYLTRPSPFINHIPDHILKVEYADI